MTAWTGLPFCWIAIETQYCGNPWMKFVVPSSGSMTQQYEDRMIRIRLAHHIDHRLLGGAIDLRDEIVRALCPHFESDPADRRALDDRAGAPRCLDCDVEHGVHGARIVS